MSKQRAGHFSCKSIAISCFLLLFSWTVNAQSIVDRSSITNPTEIWSAWGGQVELKLQDDIFVDWGLSLRANELSGAGHYFQVPVQNLGSLEFHSPAGNFAGFIDGSLTLNQSFILANNEASVSWSEMVMRPADGFPFSALQLQDGAGNVLFYATNIHVYVAQERDQLVMERMDIFVSESLAQRLGRPGMANQFIGELAMELNLNVPAGAQTEVLGTMCSDRPKWPTDGFTADVGLTNMNTIQDVGTISADGDTFELIAPSSSLVNLVGLDGADVPWYTKFMGTFEPYNNDQHPYLIWNLFRVDSNGVIEQIGVSGIKHAFLTINSNCTLNCNDSHILWPGCGDVYGVGNNDSNRDVGPRFEVNPLTGVFVSNGSFFDPGNQGFQTNDSDAPGENRMHVLREDLQTPGAQYFFESWYVIRDDSNIFNSMGYRPITPNNVSGNSWTYGLDPFAVGPVIDQWVPPGTDPATGSQNTTFNNATDIGHFKLAVRTEDIGSGQFRYTYMLQNFDVAEGIAGLNLNASLSGITSVGFHDVDQNASNDWAVVGADIDFRASVGNQMAWGTAYTFTFIGGPPLPGRATVRYGDVTSGRTVDVDILVPALGESLLADGFEGP